jgi:hypothetical protein
VTGAPGPTAMTVASGRGLDVVEDGRKIPDDFFCYATAIGFVIGREGVWEGESTVSGWKRWTKTRSRRDEGLDLASSSDISQQRRLTSAGS